jgi:hypothetical protein
MDVDLVVVDQGAITPFRIFASSVEEEARNDGLSDQRVVFGTALDGEPVPLQQFQQLLAYVFGSSQTPLLDEVVLGPGSAVVLVLPGLKDLQVGEVVALEMVEPRLLLIGQRLLLLRTVEDVLH